MILIPTLLKSSSRERLPDNIVKPKEGLIEYVLSMILHDTTGSRIHKTLTKSLIQQILISYGESSLACDDDLVEEMMVCAQSNDGILTPDTFKRALTEDVKLYDIQNEVKHTTNYDDVFLTQNHNEVLHPKHENDEEIGGISATLRQERLSKSLVLKRLFTAPSIDFVAGTYRSKTLIVTLLAAFTIGYFRTYRFGMLSDVQLCGSEKQKKFVYGANWAENTGALACATSQNVLEWLVVFLGVSLYGLLYVGLGSIGNDIMCRRFYIPLIGVLIICVFTFSPLKDFKDDIYLIVATYCLSLVSILLHLSHSIILLLPRCWLHKLPRLEAIMMSDGILSAVSAKRAAAHKINVLLKNALDLVTPTETDVFLDTHYGQGLLAFAKHGKRYEDIGFLWILKRIYSRDAFDREGIFLSARVLAANISQYVVTVFVLIAGIQLTKQVIENYSKEEAKQQAGHYVNQFLNQSVDSTLVNGAVVNLSHIFSQFLLSNQVVFGQNCSSTNQTGAPEEACDLVNDFYKCNETILIANNSSSLCSLLDSSVNSSSANGTLQLGLLNAAGLDIDSITQIATQATEAAAQASIDSLYPAEEYMISVPLKVGSIVAFLTALSLALTYLPSVTSTTLKLRSGVIPTFRSAENFQQYRFASDQVTILTGSMFWGCLISSVLVGSLIGGIVFVFLWQATVPFVQQFVATLIGILIVLVIKLIIVRSCRCTMYVAFYRKRPAAGNISALALECANFALSVGFVFLRLVKILFTGALYVGRIDTPFLAEGVGRIGGLELDNYPRIFMKDILAHEAHRHPYINLLGVMYLMKLRYGEHFGNRAGSTWRLIFVHALMPWLNKYRLLTRESIIHENFTTRNLEFKSLRRVVDDDDEDRSNDEMAAIAKPLSSTLNKCRYTASQRTIGATLLAQEIGEERLIEVEKENVSLKNEVFKLEDEVKRLKALLEAGSEHSPQMAPTSQRVNMESNTRPPYPVVKVGVGDDIKVEGITAE